MSSIFFLFPFLLMLNPCFFSKISFPLWFLTEIARIQSGGKPPGRDSKFVDIYHEKPIRLTVRALVPVKEHPKVSVSLLNLEEIWKLLISQFSTREKKLCWPPRLSFFCFLKNALKILKAQAMNLTDPSLLFSYTRYSRIFSKLLSPSNDDIFLEKGGPEGLKIT